MVVLGVQGCYNDAADFKALKDNYQKTEAKVAWLDCGNHGRIVYSFKVGEYGHVSGVAGSKVFPHSKCTEIPVGATLTVYYNPDNPSIHSVLMPHVAYSESRGWYLPEWVILIVGPIVIIALSVLTNHRTPPPKSDHKT